MSHILRIVLSTVLPVLLIVTLACERKPLPPDVIALVGERHVTLSAYKRYLERGVGSELGQLPPEAASALLDQYLEEILVAEFALQSGYDIPAERITAEVRLNPGSSPLEVRDELLRDAVLASVAGSIRTPSREEIVSYYENNQDEFTVEDRVHVRQILLKNTDEAEKARERLEQGEDFASLAREVSLAPTAARGGDIGVVERGDLPRAVEEAVFAIEPGEISDVVETAGSFHIFEVIDHLPAGTIELERAEPLIVSRLRGDELSRRIEQTEREAKEQITTRVFPQRITFEYSGTFPRDPSE